MRAAIVIAIAAIVAACGARSQLAVGLDAGPRDAGTSLRDAIVVPDAARPLDGRPPRPRAEAASISSRARRRAAAGASSASVA
jgi:hypothetical protein